MSILKKNINNLPPTKRVLVAPLDWGLGHATRSILIIRELLEQGFEVMLAAEKGGAALLNTEFPQLEILPLKGYRVTYSKNEKFFFFKMLLQGPTILRSIHYEHKWLSAVIKKYAIDIVISDNRFGFFNKNVHNIFITHQLYIKTGNSFSERIAQKINYRYINKFDECWVPDEAGEKNLGGVLSHPELMPRIPVKYIGVLSRFEKYTTEQYIDLLIMLSGPEPQRTLFENILLRQLKTVDLKIVLVRGLPTGKSIESGMSDNVKIFNHLAGTALNELILSSKVIVARSGYTTVMELAALNRKAILIPTPGQTEQEYIANYLSDKNYCTTSSQKSFSLLAALEQIKHVKLSRFPNTDNNMISDAISGLQ